MSNESTLPAGWVTVRLAEIALVNPATERDGLGDDDVVPFVPMRAVEPEGGGLVRPEQRRFKDAKKGYTAFQAGDIVTAKITPCMENGKTAVVPDAPGGIYFGSTEFHVLRPEAGVDPNWISRNLLRHGVRRSAQRAMSGGVGQMRVPGSYLESTSLPLPPSAEQTRIADALDGLFSDIDAGVAALEQVQQKLKLYRVSVLKAAVEGALTAEWRAGHPDVEPAPVLLARILVERRQKWEAEQLRKYEEKGKAPPKNWRSKYEEPVPPDTTGLPALPEGWCWATVGQCSSVVQYGSSAKCSADNGGVPVLRMGNVTSDGRLDLRSLKYLPSDHGELPTLLLSSGDLVFNRTNSAELVGKTALYEGTPEPCSFASYLIRVRLLDGVLPPLLAYALNGGLGREWISRVRSQTVGQANVNGSKLAAFAFPLPSAIEQVAVVEAVDEQLTLVDHLEDGLEAKLNGAQSLRQSILRHAFSGKLVPQDPTDEPASVLLERIREERSVRGNTCSKPSARKKASPKKRAGRIRP